VHRSPSANSLHPSNSEDCDYESDFAYTESSSVTSEYSSGQSCTGIAMTVIESGTDTTTRNVMAEFDRLFEELLRSFIRRCTNLSEPSGRNGSSGSGDHGHGEIFGNGGTLKRRRGVGWKEGNAEDDKDRNKPNRGPNGSRVMPGSHTNKRLACPFRKHDPSTYNIHTHRKCVQGCWPTTHRIK